MREWWEAFVAAPWWMELAVGWFAFGLWALLYWVRLEARSARYARESGTNMPSLGFGLVLAVCLLAVIGGPASLILIWLINRPSAGEEEEAQEMSHRGSPRAA